MKYMPPDDARSMSPDEEIKFDVVKGIVHELIGYWYSESLKEEAKDIPNKAKLEAIEKFMNVLNKEEQDIDFENKELLGKAEYIYGPILRALRK